MIIVYTYVVADLFHIGHLKVLQQAKELGDYLIVGVLTDEAVMGYKRKPIIPFDERLEIVKNIKCVTDAIRQDDVDPTEPTETIKCLLVKPDILTHGDDWDDNFPGAEYMRSIGKKAQTVKYIKGRPTSDQIAYLAGYMRRGEDEQSGHNLKTS